MQIWQVSTKVVIQDDDNKLVRYVMFLYILEMTIDRMLLLLSDFNVIEKEACSYFSYHHFFFYEVEYAY